MKAGIVIAYVAFLIVCFVGWVMNIASLVHMHDVTAMFVLRIVGIFVAPMGSLLGLFF